jgi:hypothetical protein
LRRASGDKLGPIASEWTEDLGEWVYARSWMQRRWFFADGGENIEYAAIIEPDEKVMRVTIIIEINASKPIVWLGIRLRMVSRPIDKLIAAQVALIEAEISRPTASEDQRRDPIAHLLYDPPTLDEPAAKRLPEARRILARLSGEEELSDRFLIFCRARWKIFSVASGRSNWPGAGRPTRTGW